ncbi:transposase, Ptta/En/Spm, transposase, Tnp1/En/Spm-like protein [Tanacetum coccineum]
METEANDLDHLVNYDNDNDVDDLGYESKVYIDEEEEDENNHSNGNVVKKGITRLSKFRREYGKPDGIKLSVTFDALNRTSEKHRALFSSFLGDLIHEHIGLKILSCKKVGSEARDKLWDEITRYFDVDLTVRKLVMNRLGQLLRNFRRKLRQTYILPNQNTLSKLNEVSAKYSAILKAEEWVNFVKYTTTEECKVKSVAAKITRSKSVYQHTIGRGGYAHVKEKMIENKEIEPDEEPPRGILWLKGKVNKDEEFPDDEIRSVGDKLKEIEDKIKEGTLKVDHGTDAIIVVLGKEKGGYARGVGSGVTNKRYFDLPRSRQASDERIVLLQGQLDNERRERQEKELEIQNLSDKMSQTEGMVSLVDINPIDSSADEEGGTPIVGCENDASIQKSNGLATSKKEMETRCMGYKKKAVVVTLDPLALVAEKTKVSKRKEKVVVQSESEGSDDEDINDLKKITALTSSASSSANKKPEYVKSEEKKEDKKADEKKRDMSKVKCYNCKKEGHFAKDCKKAKVKDYNYYKTKMLLAKKDVDEQVLLAKDQAWMESSNSEESSSSAKETIAEGLFVNNDNDQEIFHDAIESASEIFNENHIVSQTDHDQSEIDHNDSEEKDHLVDKLIKKFNHKISKCQKRIKKANQQSKDLENQNKDLQDKYDVLKNQVNTFEEKNNKFNEQIKVLNEKNDDFLAQTDVLQEQLKSNML